MPAEWEPHRGTWLVWPHNDETWPGRLEAVQQAYAHMIAALAPGEWVFVVVASEEHRRTLFACLETHAGWQRWKDHVRVLHWPTNDSWVRDTGPTAVLAERADGAPGGGPRFRRAHVCWRFNAWGGKYPPWDDDDALAGRIAAWLGEPAIEADLVLEGGSIDVDGAGTLLTTEQCLLHPNRNPGLDRAAIEARLRALLGIERIVWLGEGIVGDDTDGHVDDVARFVDRETIAVAVEPDPGHPNHAPLADNLERLRALRTVEGRPYRIVELPQPPDVLSPDGDPLPASYANFYVANGVVLVPAYHPDTDARALAALRGCFPERRVVAIPSRDLVLGLGAVHCLTQPLPAL
ncbi:MAG: agmatine deiminase family protein [Planctomycetota bacterium]|nr:MAG: agmatine deiminase family protein [Planctomycetota bacterium]